MLQQKTIAVLPGTPPTAVAPGKGSAMFIIGGLFFIFGFVTWLNGMLIPFLKLACQLETDMQAFFVTFAFYMAYFFLALPSSYILQKTGYKKGMALGLLVMAFGSIIFIPAAQTRSFTLFLCGLFIQGGGLAILQTASNPYVSILGPMESAAKRISIMGVCNKVAGALSPLILGAIVMKNADELTAKLATTVTGTEKEILLDELAGRILVPYAIMAAVLLVLSFFIHRSSLPEMEAEPDSETEQAVAENTKSRVFKYPHLLLGVLCMFLYVGAEVMAGDAIGIYGQSLGLPYDQTKYFTSYTLAAMLIGYLIGIVTIPHLISQQTGLKLSAMLGIVFTLCIYWTTGITSIVFIALLGLANALMWPAIFPLAIAGLGKFTKVGSALLIMSIAGGALIPLLYGMLKEVPTIGNGLSFLICMLPSYTYILFYSITGYKVGRGARFR